MNLVFRLLHLTILFSAYTALIVTTPTWADAEHDNYTPAKRLETEDAMRYPGTARHGGREGYVIYSVLVTPDGDTKDFSIVYSNGDKAIEKEVRKYNERSRFEPATLDGRAIESRFYFAQTFYQIGKFRGTSRRFSSDWKKFNRSLAAGNNDNALKRIQAMEKVGHRSLYEDFHLQLAWANYHLNQGDGTSAYQRLSFMASFYRRLTRIGTETIIDPSAFFLPVFHAYRYAINNGLLGDANMLKEILTDIGPETNTATAVSEHFNTVARQFANQPLEVEIELRTWPVGSTIPAGGLILFHRRFSIEATRGNLQDVTVVCDNWQRTLTTTQYRSFTVPTGLDDCGLFILGSDATKVSVLQFPDHPNTVIVKHPEARF